MGLGLPQPALLPSLTLPDLQRWSTNWSEFTFYIYSNALVQAFHTVLRYKPPSAMACLHTITVYVDLFEHIYEF